MMARVFLQVIDGLARLTKDVFLPLEKLAPEIFDLPLIHERFVIRRTIILSQLSGHQCLSLHRCRMPSLLLPLELDRS
jgi:hypothetical protein